MSQTAKVDNTRLTAEVMSLRKLSSTSKYAFGSFGGVLSKIIGFAAGSLITYLFETTKKMVCMLFFPLNMYSPPKQNCKRLAIGRMMQILF